MSGDEAWEVCARIVSEHAQARAAPAEIGATRGEAASLARRLEEYGRRLGQVGEESDDRER